MIFEQMNKIGMQNRKMQYRLALNLNSHSIGWAMIRLNKDCQPCAIIKTGVRIFSDGRNKKDGTSLAVARQEARAARRLRTRFVKRRTWIIDALTRHKFFPQDEAQRKALEIMNPYYLRAKGLNEALLPAEFARALFHMNQRRGFKSSRESDKNETDIGALKGAINNVRSALLEENCRTVGEWLYRRYLARKTVRARYRQNKVENDGKAKTEKSYDLYIDRAMIEAEFDALWSKQSSLNPDKFTEAARNELKEALLNQRPLKPVKPGRCTFLPDEERALLALPSTQRFRIYQEVNHLRILLPGLNDKALTLEQRNKLVQSLEENRKRSFAQIKKLLGIEGSVQFNFEDPKREEFKGNLTSVILSKAENFGGAWFSFDEAKQDAIVFQLMREESETRLIRWLQDETGVNEARAESIVNASTSLPVGYGRLSALAIKRILPELQRDVVTYHHAVLSAGFEHHTNPTLCELLPYYGLPLRRHVGFGSDNPDDPDEKRYGRIANPSVHIGLNQVRLLVNTLVGRYGPPAEVIVEVARDLKQSKAQKDADIKQQAANQKRNQRLRAEIAIIQQISEESVKTADIQKMILWEELSADPAERRCPYSGIQISARMVLSHEVEVDYILPFSQTLDDSLNNKTLAMRQANRVKGNATPWEAFGAREQTGFNYLEIIQRAEAMPKAKSYRFGQNGYQTWLKDDDGFLARALNDKRHMSVIARNYLSLICPKVHVIPGLLTSRLRAWFGLNNILNLHGEKIRDDYRHYAINACVIGVTDYGMLQRLAKASADKSGKQSDRVIEDTPVPWNNYLAHVTRAINNTWVSHRPNHSHEGAMHDETAYGLRDNGKVSVHKMIDGKRTRIEKNLKVIEFTCSKANDRHGVLPDGTPKPYKGYCGNNNYCVEIVRGENDKWEGVVLSTFEAYRLVRKYGIERLRNKTESSCGKPLVMRLMINDTVRLEINNVLRTMRVTTIGQNGQVFMIDVHEANAAARARNKDADEPLAYISKTASTLQKAKGRRISISPTGELRDPGFGNK